jgi:transcriptional regulator with XRE-family HTH domain
MAKAPSGPFGAWLREWRKANRHSLASFAAEAGLTKGHAWELERGHDFNPTLATLMAISKATNTAFTRVAMLAAQQKMGANND